MTEILIETPGPLTDLADLSTTPSDAIILTLEVAQVFGAFREPLRVGGNVLYSNNAPDGARSEKKSVI